MNQDLDKCNGIGCQIKDNFQRFLAKRKELDYFIKQDLGIVKKEKECRFYKNVEENNRTNLEKYRF